MCLSKSKPPEPVTPAPAPAPALDAPDAPSVGESRRAESRANHGEDAPSYRVKRPKTGNSINPDGPIVM